MTLFKDKVVIVTGAASGIGKALCQQLSTKQAIIFITDIDLIQCQQLAIQITQSGGRAVAAKLDVSNLLEFEQLILSVCQQHQKLDYIFNNAGIGIAAEVQDMQIEDWQNIVNINLWGVINGTTTAYKIMVKQGFGHIVNIASLAGLIGSPTMTAYATTKSAIIGLSNSLRMEAKSLGVKVSVVCPGFIQTSIFDSAIKLSISKEKLISLIPFKMIDPQTAADIILTSVVHNKAFIVFPFYARLAWWLSRICPSLVEIFHRKTIEKFRAYKASRLHFSKSKKD